VVVFSKSFCPFCLEVKSTFAAKRVPIVLIELDKTPNGSKIQAALKAMTNQGTVPNVFIQGDHIGGCDDTKALEATGELDRRVAPFVLRRADAEGSQVALKGTDGGDSVLSKTMPPTAHKTPGHSKAGGKAAAGPQGRAVMPLFYFPTTVNHHVVRLMVRGGAGASQSEP
jgi:glutaredoxin 3